MWPGGVLNSYSVDPGPVGFVIVLFPTMDPALVAHRVDAPFITGSFLPAAKARHGVVPLVDMGHTADTTFPIAGHVTKQVCAANGPKTQGMFAAELARGQRVAAATIARGTYPLTMTGNDLIRVATLMTLNGLLPPKVNATVLAKEMITGGH